MKHPIPNPGELLARCRANAVKARQAGRTAMWRCPACEDLGWVLERGTTVGGHRDVPVARRCTGPTASGCAWWRHELDRQPKVKPARRRMDED